jgi:hypothetical protein
MRLTPAQQASRRALDFEVIERMNGRIWSATAFSSSDDLAAARREIQSATDGSSAEWYRVRFDVPTLVGPGELEASTEIGFGLTSGNYPYSEPITWIVSSHVPYSPHFKEGSPVCIGEIWTEARGRMLLGQLFNRIARMLNWDEQMRGRGYRGWNGAAIDYHKRVYGGQPLDPKLMYPLVPLDITHGLGIVADDTTSGTNFEWFSFPSSPVQPRANDTDFFSWGAS